MTAERLLVTGAPRTGKSTLAYKLCPNDSIHLCTDPQRLCTTPGAVGTPDELGWSEASQWIADKWLTKPGPWIVEGVAVPRALRKYLAANGPDAPPPCDKLIVLVDPHEALTPNQAAMGDALMQIIDDLYDWLAPVLEYR